MYVTRPLSVHRNKYGRESEQAEPLDGPNTGVLVIDDEAHSKSSWLFGNTNKSVKVPPFPQNKLLKLRHSEHHHGRHRHHDHSSHHLHAMLIPVLNQPSNSNQYYIIKSQGTKKGLAYTSLGEDEMSECSCFGIPDKSPQIFDPTNPYQQFQISKCKAWWEPDSFVSKSVAPDARPPHFLRHKGWTAHTNTLKNFKPTQALGLDAALRARLPELNSQQPVVVGKWYCPFIFIRDGEVSAQMKNSPYYEMTLHQNWEQIFGRCKFDGELVGNNGVAMDVSVKRQVIRVGGLAAERAVVCGVMWFGTTEVGLSMAIVGRVKWEQERGGFKWRENEEIERVVRTDKFEGRGDWNRFECYILVEKFVLKRMDESVLLTWEFRHTHQIRTKWE